LSIIIKNSNENWCEDLTIDYFNILHQKTLAIENIFCFMNAFSLIMEAKDLSVDLSLVHLV